MKLVVWGYGDVEEANKVITIREKDLREPDLRKNLLEEFASLMREHPYEDPKDFFEATRVSILAAPKVWEKFLLALKEFEQEEQVKNHLKKEGKIWVFISQIFF